MNKPKIEESQRSVGKDTKKKTGRLAKLLCGVDVEWSPKEVIVVSHGDTVMSSLEAWLFSS